VSHPKKLTAEERMLAILAQLPRGQEARGGYRPVPFVDAIHACEQHAAAAVAEITEERDALRHSHALISVDIERWRTDCSTPVYEMVRNAIADYEKVTRERDAARAEVKRIRELHNAAIDVAVVFNAAFDELEGLRAAVKAFNDGEPDHCFVQYSCTGCRIETARKAADGGEEQP
jgi:hypothetical protein